MSVLTTTIDNVNPLIQYLPSNAWSEGARDSGGDTYFARYSDGGTFTLTTTDSAYAELSFNGTAVTLFGAKRPNHSFYNITLDGSPSSSNPYNGTSDNPIGNWGSLYSVDGLSAGSHTVRITNIVGAAGNFFDLDYITFNTTIDVSLSTVQDTDASFSYEPQAWNTSVLNVSQFNGSSGHMSCSNGGLATYTFQVRDAVQLFGTVGPEIGPYTVQLDNNQPVNYNANKQYFAANTMLYAASYIGSGLHTLNITNEASQSDSCLTLDYALALPANISSASGTSAAAGATASASTSTSRSSSSHGGLIGGIVAAVVIILAIAAGLALWLRRRHKVNSDADILRDKDPFYNDVLGSSAPPTVQLNPLYANTTVGSYPAQPHTSNYDPRSQTNQVPYRDLAPNRVGGQYAGPLLPSVDTSSNVAAAGSMSRTQDAEVMSHHAPSTFTSYTSSSRGDNKSQYIHPSSAPSSNPSNPAVAYSPIDNQIHNSAVGDDERQQTGDGDLPPPNYSDVFHGRR